MLNSSTERVPAWRLQQTVNILRASREMPVIRFPGGTKRTGLGEEFVVDPAAAMHLNTKSAFAWWYLRDMGVYRRLGGRLRANTPKKMASRSLFASGIVYPSCSTATVSAFGETVEKWFRHSSCFDKDGFPFASDPEGMQHGCCCQAIRTIYDAFSDSGGKEKRGSSVESEATNCRPILVPVCQTTAPLIWRLPTLTTTH